MTEGKCTLRKKLLSKLILKIGCYNIEGHHFLLNHPTMEKYLQKYDIVFLCETHALAETSLSLEGYKTIENPCRLCDQKYPRGGTVFFVKKCLEKYINFIEKTHNDAIVLNMINGNTICGIYISLQMIVIISTITLNI